MDDLDIYARLRALSTLDDPDFIIACSAEPELQMICNGTFKPGHSKQFNHLTDFLYKTRSEYYFDKSLLKYQEGISWKEFYERLTYLYKNINGLIIADKMASDGKLIELKILVKIGKFPTKLGANWAAGHGHLNVLKWLLEQKETHLKLPDSIGADMAAGNGYVNVLQWMKQNNLPFPTQTGANWAVQYGHLNVLEWMKENNLPLPNKTRINLAARNGHVNVLEWLASQNPPILPN